VSRFLDWQIALPRLLAVVVLLLALQYGLGLAMRSKAVQTVEDVVGAPVELAHARVSLVRRQISLNDVRIASPRCPLEYLVEADRCELHFAARPLLRKQAVIERGTVTGLRFGTPRDTGGVQAGPSSRSAAQIDWFDANTASGAREWLDALGERFDQDLISRLQSVALTSQLCERWPRQSAELRARFRELTQQADKLQEQAREATANPLRHGNYLNNVPDQTGALRRDFEQFAEELRRLEDLVDADRRAIVRARRDDESLLHELLQTTAVDDEALNAYLLRAQVAASLEELIGWLRFARRIVPANGPAWKLPGTRGEDVIFAGCERSPGFLIRSLDLQGTARLGGRPAKLRGVAWPADSPSLGDHWRACHADGSDD
jgi:uncharacterized protein (TIGR03545 family)